MLSCYLLGLAANSKINLGCEISSGFPATSHQGGKRERRGEKRREEEREGEGIPCSCFWKLYMLAFTTSLGLVPDHRTYLSSREIGRVLFKPIVYLARNQSSITIREELNNTTRISIFPGLVSIFIL